MTWLAHGAPAPAVPRKPGSIVSMREVRDAAGNLWVVFDVIPSTGRRSQSQVKPGYAAGWLCFQCPTERRRHPGLPAQWTALSDREILALIDGAADTRLMPLQSS